MPEDLTQKSLEFADLKSLLDSSVDVIVRFSIDGLLHYISSASFNLIGQIPGDLYQKSLFNFICEDKVEEFKLQVDEILHSGKVISFRSELINNKNENIAVEFTLRKIVIDENIFVQGTIRDIRLRIETQRKLFSSENIFITIWENTKDGMRLTDQDGNVVLCNKAFANLFGKSTDEIINRPISDLYAAERSEEIINNYKRNFIRGMVKDYLETSATLWNGSQLYFEVSNSIIDDFDGKRFLLSIFRDIGERKVNENLIYKKGRLLQGIAKASNALITDSQYLDGFNVALKIIPYLVAMLVAIGIFRASGGMDILVWSLSPITNLVGMPAEALPMALMRPLSGSGSIAIMTEIIKTHGPDSLLGLMVSTFFGSTETTFYVLAVYFGSVSIKRTRHALPAGLIADVVGLLAAVFIVRLLFT